MPPSFSNATLDLDVMLTLQVESGPDGRCFLKGRERSRGEGPRVPLRCVAFEGLKRLQVVHELVTKLVTENPDAEVDCNDADALYQADTVLGNIAQIILETLSGIQAKKPKARFSNQSSSRNLHMTEPERVWRKHR